MNYSFEEKLLSVYKQFVKKHGMRHLAAFVLSFPLIAYRLVRYFSRNSKRFLAIAFSVLVFSLSLSFTDAAGAEEMKAHADAAAIPDTGVWTEDEDFLSNLGNRGSGDTASSNVINNGKEFSSGDWKLILVNKQHPIPDGYEVTLGTLNGWQRCDERIIPDIKEMVSAASEDGLKLVIASPYRENDRQEMLFGRKIKNYMAVGMSYIDAYKKASQAVTVPGASEHEIGLALDIISPTYRSLNEGFEDTPEGKWLAENSWKYGFILRYPKGREHITSIEYEPWHFRYVGADAAKVMYEEKLTLEEFWDKYL
ncbi:MAG: M15 family metallopeptidase [Lachnospiraceae bacterium]|nr:M15 family metallopeptidase [Lachnospiraceae bacterium]